MVKFNGHMIMVFLDTNIVMRYLLDDNIELSAKARQIIDSTTYLFICTKG